jgi:hypothetical protein
VCGQEARAPTWTRKTKCRRRRTDTSVCLDVRALVLSLALYYSFLCSSRSSLSPYAYNLAISLTHTCGWYFIIFNLTTDIDNSHLFKLNQFLVKFTYEINPFITASIYYGFLGFIIKIIFGPSPIKSNKIAS